MVVSGSIRAVGVRIAWALADCSLEAYNRALEAYETPKRLFAVSQGMSWPYGAMLRVRNVESLFLVWNRR